MTSLRSLDPVNDTVTVEAGCTLADVKDAAAGIARLFPLSLASEGSCTIGGNLSTNAGGTGVLRYGNARELCLGVEAVLPNGDVVSHLSGLRKDNTGYHWSDLLIGARRDARRDHRRDVAPPVGVTDDGFRTLQRDINRLVHDAWSHTAVQSAPSTESGSQSATSSPATRAPRRWR